jgi:hypothetical protein
MAPFEIFIAYISWGRDGKRRPVLILKKPTGGSVLAYYITTQYERKSRDVQKHYFKINDWLQAGLEKQSYIDTRKPYDVPLEVMKIKNPIGKLTMSDKMRLYDFLHSI